LPYILEPIRKVPVGVVPSPSLRFEERPFLPSRAPRALPTATQQPCVRRQVRRLAYVVRATFASTVISCRALAGTPSRPWATF
jgi:hypothetical protein